MNIPREAMSRGGKNRAAMLRRQVLARLVGLTPIEAFRLGYVRGLQSKHRQITRLKIRAVLRQEHVR